MQSRVTIKFENSPNTNTFLFTYGYSTHITVFNVLVRPHPLIMGNYSSFSHGVTERSPAEFVCRRWTYILLDNSFLMKPSFYGLSSVSRKLLVLSFQTGVNFTGTRNFGVHSLLSVHPKICYRNYFSGLRSCNFLVLAGFQLFFNPVRFSVAGNHYKQDNYERWDYNIEIRIILSRLLDTEFMYFQITIQAPDFRCVHARRYLIISEISSVGLLSKTCRSLWEIISVWWSICCSFRLTAVTA